MSEQPSSAPSQGLSAPSLAESAATGPRFTNDTNFFGPAEVTVKCKAKYLPNSIVTYYKVDGEMTDIKRFVPPSEQLDGSEPDSQPAETLYRAELSVKYNTLGHNGLGSFARCTWMGAAEDRPVPPTINTEHTAADIDEVGNLVSAMQLRELVEIPIPDDLKMPEGHTHVSTCDIVATEDLTQFRPTMTRVWTANTPDNPLGSNQAAGQQARQW